MTSAKAKMLLAFIILGICFFLIYLVICMTIPADKKEVVMFILGFLSAVISSVVNYYFGSSSSSSKKSETIDKLTEATGSVTDVNTNGKTDINLNSK